MSRRKELCSFKLLRVAAVLVVGALSSCGGEAPAPGGVAPAADVAAAAAATATATATDETDRGRGIVNGVDLAGNRVLLEHEAMPKIGMGSMTMYFEATSDIDLARFVEGDAVQVEVKRGRDGSFRIMAMCLAAADAADCLPSIGTQ